MAMTGRLYMMAVSNISVAAAMDIMAIYSGSSHIFAVRQVKLQQVTVTTVQNLRFRLVRLPATVSAGSGGSAGTLKPYTRPGDAAASITGRYGDTSQATTGGTAVILDADGWTLVNGDLWVPPDYVNPPVIGLSEALSVSLDQAPSVSITVNASILVEELP